MQFVLIRPCPLKTSGTIEHFGLFYPYLSLLIMARPAYTGYAPWLAPYFSFQALQQPQLPIASSAKLGVFLNNLIGYLGKKPAYLG